MRPSRIIILRRRGTAWRGEGLTGRNTQTENKCPHGQFRKQISNLLHTLEPVSRRHDRGPRTWIEWEIISESCSSTATPWTDALGKFKKGIQISFYYTGAKFHKDVKWLYQTGQSWAEPPELRDVDNKCASYNLMKESQPVGRYCKPERLHHLFISIKAELTSPHQHPSTTALKGPK